MAGDKKGTESWAWLAFHKGSLYKSNRTHREARCCGEAKLAEARGQLQAEEILTNAAIHELALDSVTPICGKVADLKKHIKKCEHVDAKWKKKLDGEADEDEPMVESAAGSTKRQGTFLVNSEPAPKRFKSTKQAEFDSDTLKLWTVLNASYNSIGIPFVSHFFSKWVGAEVPGRKALSGHVLDSDVEKIQEKTKKEIKGEFATGSVDGWSTKHDAIQQTSCNVRGKEYALNIHVTMKERKTSANLLTHVLADLQMLTLWGAVIVAFCCDPGGNSKGLWPLLLRAMPWILTIPCWAHQINLVVSDFIKKGNITEILSQCLVVINWFSSHKRALLMLLEEQQVINKARLPGEKWEHLKRFVRAGITRWGTHAMSTRRLLQLQTALIDLVNHRLDELRLAGGEKQDAIDAAEAVINLIDSGRNGIFWSGVFCANHYLTPLAIAANVTQGANTCLDHVLITLAMLHLTYSLDNSFAFGDDNKIICDSLEKRWMALKRDQDFYVVAVFLNPFLRAFYFNRAIHSLSRTGLYAVVKRVYKRMFRILDDSIFPPQLFQQYLDYYDSKTIYTTDSMAVRGTAPRDHCRSLRTRATG
ncbi:ribonuclease H-like domain-containing protein [Mycena galopus ATCC 62051]|nr:ribonuclease H-like domain-containing protein [Mycena galopus ATCC 62051]